MATKTRKATKTTSDWQNDPEAFTLRAIQSLRKPPYKGINAVYSGFNEAFKATFGTDPKDTTKRMADKGLISIVPSKKHTVMLYLAKDAPDMSQRNTESKVKAALKAMGA